MKVYNGASLFIYLIKRLGKIKEKEDVKYNKGVFLTYIDYFKKNLIFNY